MSYEGVMQKIGILFGTTLFVAAVVLYTALTIDIGIVIDIDIDIDIETVLLESGQSSPTCSNLGSRSPFLRCIICTARMCTQFMSIL